MKTNLKRFTIKFLTIVFIAVLSSRCDKKESQAPAWSPLFNGKDLTGWDIKIAGHQLNDNYKNTFRVEDGMLRIAYDQYQSFDNKFGHLYYKTPYSFYRLRLQYRFVGKQTPGAP